MNSDLLGGGRQVSTDSEVQQVLSDWMNGLSDKQINVWREAMTQLRQTHGDVWNGVKFFLTINGVLLAAIFAIARSDNRDFLDCGLLVFLTVVGLSVSLVARKILIAHRRYYLEMLLRKTLIEKALGFYQTSVAGRVLSFPWNVDIEDVPAIESQPNKWVKGQMSPRGRITGLLFSVYHGVISIYVLALVIVLVALYSG